MAIKIFQNLRSLLPIPGKWSEEGKSFALKVEDAYKWLQTQMANDRENTEASKAKKIGLGGTANSWEKIWDRINVLGTGEAAVVYIYASTTAILTGGKLTASYAGVVWRSAQGTFRFLVSNTNDDSVDFTISGASASSAGTCNYKLNANAIKLTSSDDSWAKVWAKISVLSTGETATLYVHGDAMDAMTDGVRTAQGVGIIARYSSSQFQIIYRPSYQYIYTGLLSNANSSGATYQDTIITSTGQLSDLTTTTKTNLVAAINEVNGKILRDDIVYQASATTHKFTVPTGSRNLVIFSGDGTTYAWIGYVYGSSTGSVTTATIYQGSRVTSITTATNAVTFTFSAASSCYLRSINLRNGTLS